MTMDSTMQRHIIDCGTDIRSALERINRLPGGAMTLFVCAADGSVAGSLTDGDIRRGLLGGASLADSVDTVMRGGFLFLADGKDPLAVIDEARRRGVSMLPRLDNAGRLAGIADLRSLRSVLPLDAVIMAGGKGMRLRPLTLTTPKPLLPVGGKPIIDHNVELLRRYGIDDIFVTVNYRHELIERHFASAAPAVTCVRETEPLGTFGSLSIVPRLRHDNVAVMNADLLTDIDFEAMYRRHTGSGAALTVAVVPYTVSVPYAIIGTNDDDDTVTSIDEKPTYNYFANAGVYILKKTLVGIMPANRRMDATDFIDLLLKRGGKVAYYPIDGTWTDIGSPDDYRCVCERMSHTPKS